MASYNGGGAGRSGHALYSHIANLNTIPSEYDIALQQQQDGYNMQADLDMFTNTQFFDFDMGESQEADGLIKSNGAGNAAHGLDLDFLNAAQTYNNGYTGLVNSHTNPSSSGIRPHHQQHLHHHNHHHTNPHSAFPSSTSSPTSTGTPLSLPVLNTSEGHSHHRTTDTPSATTSTYPLDPTSATVSASASATPGANPSTPFEEASRAAAEEDKRRRNTAASARFRVKKKQREQALERASREMGERVAFLEARVGQLEMENRLLKELVVERGGSGKAQVEALERKVVGGRRIIGGTTKPGTVAAAAASGKVEAVEEDDDDDDNDGEEA